jgi:Sulfotransferase family
MSGQPILVTGMPRSGTTWLAHMLAAAGGLVYVNEPLNPNHPPGGFPGVLNAPVEHRFQYICAENDERFLPAYRDLMRLRYHPLAELRQNHRPGDVPRQARHAAMFAAGRLRRKRVLVADPYAVFSTPWFARRGFKVVVIVRRPVAAIASRKRLGWIFEPEELRRQPLLVRDVIEPLGIATGPARAPREERLIDTGALLWAAIHSAVAAAQDELADALVVVRHEDLSRQPKREFARLYERLGLRFSARAARQIERATTAAASETPVGDPHAVRLDSRANLENWRRRLTAQEVERIQALTGQSAQRFYPVVDDTGAARRI